MKRVTAAIIFRDGRILVARRAPGEKLAGKWEFPGGKIEPGESAEECLARELEEELGVKSKVGDFVGSSVFHYDHDSIELLAYRVEHLSGDFTPSVHDKLAWVLPSDLQSVDLADADVPLAETVAARE